MIDKTKNRNDFNQGENCQVCNKWLRHYADGGRGLFIQPTLESSDVHLVCFNAKLEPAAEFRNVKAKDRLSCFSKYYTINKDGVIVFKFGRKRLPTLKK